MARTLHVRDVPDEIHAVLVRRATRRGLSLRQYTVEVLAAHCALPAMDEWLHGLSDLDAAGQGPERPFRAGATALSAADAVEQAREVDDLEILGGSRRR